MKVSVIIPAKNEESNIRYCLHALKTLNFPRDQYEVIVIDNGSSDETVPIVRNYGYSVYVKPDLSLSGLRNFGASVASGSVFAFLDADCVPDKEWLNNMAAALDNPEIGCTGSTPKASISGTWVERVWSSFRTRRKSRRYVPWINSSNFIIRRELFVKVGGFNENVMTCEDVDICMRVNKICKILFDPSIEVTHLGEPKTIRKFFLKEVWRGRGAVSGVISHGIRSDEMRSIALPLYYLFVNAGLVAGIAFCSTITLSCMGILYVAPAMLFSAWVTQKTRRTDFVAGYFVLFLVYANARAVALFLK